MKRPQEHIVNDPLGVLSSGALDVACQIVHMEPSANGTLVDLVTLEPCDRDGGGASVPAGTPVTLAFGADRSDPARSSIESTMTLWDVACTIVHLQVGNAPEGLRYRFTGGERSLTVLVRPRLSAN
jgi:hypothetical protein